MSGTPIGPWRSARSGWQWGGSRRGGCPALAGGGPWGRSRSPRSRRAGRSRSGRRSGHWRSAGRRLGRAISALTGSSRQARASHADTVHPGYGFLSKNWRFAEACQRAGLTFVGPSPDAIRRMGDETEARRLRAGVPVVPGSHETTAHAVEAERVACEIGYPVMLKAAAGGGGIGMARGDKAGELPPAFAMATRPAQAAFGRPDVYVERYLERPRHVEIQGS